MAGRQQRVKPNNYGLALKMLCCGQWADLPEPMPSRCDPTVQGSASAVEGAAYAAKAAHGASGCAKQNLKAQICKAL